MIIRVMVADDHPIVRYGLVKLLEIESDPDILVVGEASDGDMIPDAVQTLAPDVLLLDIGMLKFDAVEQVQQLRNLAHSPKILILTMHDDIEYVGRLIEAGVSGYMLKDEAVSTIVQAIRVVAEGGTWFSQQIAGRLLRLAWSREDEVEVNGTVQLLRPREYEILQLIACGKTNNEIAKQLTLSKATVQNYISAIYTKLGIETRSQVVLYALRHNLINLEEIPELDGVRDR